MHRFFIDFRRIWDPILEPSWSILAPSWPSWPLLKLLLALLGAILAPRCSPGSQTPPALHYSRFSSFGEDFVEDFVDFFKLQGSMSNASKIEVGMVAALRARRIGYSYTYIYFFLILKHKSNRARFIYIYIYTRDQDMGPGHGTETWDRH